MDSHFQVIVLGTGLSESIAAAALAKAGLRVAHIDPNPYYGADEASLTTAELKQFIDTYSGRLQSSNTKIPSASMQGELPSGSSSRGYSLSLSPSIIPSNGPFITALIGSGVAHYGGFKMLDNISVYSPDGFKSVPGSKEEIFKSKEFSLMDKRKLMRFLTFAVGEFETSSEIQGRETMPFISFLEEVFSLSSNLASVLAYALAFCTRSSDTTLPSLVRIRRYLRSAGRYGPSPFLVGQYGGLGELSQGFCRVCAVSGGTYILGRSILSLDVNESSIIESDGAKSFQLRLSDVPEDLTADVVISSSAFLHKIGSGKIEYEDGTTEEMQMFCIALIDGTIFTPGLSADMSGNAEDDVDPSDQARQVDASLLVFPPGELSTGKAPGPVSVLINGEGTLSCPYGKSILYLLTTVENSTIDEQAPNPELILRPYLEATLSQSKSVGKSPPKELISAFYARTSRPITPASLTSLKEKGVIVSPSFSFDLAEAGDVAATNGEALFRAVLKHICKHDANEIAFWPPLPSGPDDGDDDIL